MPAAEPSVADPLATVLLVLTWAGVSAYVLLAAADFCGGPSDLLVGGRRRGAR